MRSKKLLAVLLMLGAAILPGNGLAQDIPAADKRMAEVRHLDLPYQLPEYRTQAEWQARAAELRKQILVSAGLSPMPDKTPIRATIFGLVDGGNYTVEKVYFESSPGFYVTGNLYRPKNVTGKVPAVLCPHGHWTYGRLENQPNNSGPARAANFARQGYVAFSYDMVGYNDSAAISHRFADHNVTGREALWGVNLLGLQLWNSMRALDFLLTLPEVDAERIACTGESGGGTQTFLLMAVDERVKTASPVNMVSFIMQGGSLCENAPNLRVDTNNVEFAALMAPRPLFLVSATGDWTKNMLTSEYPAIQRIYRLFSAEDKVAAVQMNAPHNYNQESREAVYGWFAHWLQSRAERSPIKERSGGVAAAPDLLVFYGRPRPANELNEAQLADSLIAAAKKQLADALPKDAAGLARYRAAFGDAYKYSLLAAEPTPAELIIARGAKATQGDIVSEPILLSRKQAQDRVALTIWRSNKNAPTPAVSNFVLAPVPVDTDLNSALAQLVKAGHTVVTLKSFAGGREIPKNIKFFTTYNRTDEANRVQDILTALTFMRQSLLSEVEARGGKTTLSVVAQGRAGLVALLARGLASRVDRMVVDAGQFDSASEADFLKLLPIPGLRRAGDFTTAIALAPLTPLLVHNTGGKFATETIAGLYARLGRAEHFQAQTENISEAALLAWLTGK